MAPGNQNVKAACARDKLEFQFVQALVTIIIIIIITIVVIIIIRTNMIVGSVSTKCGLQTAAGHCFHHAKENMTTIVPLFSNHENSGLQSIWDDGIKMQV